MTAVVRAAGGVVWRNRPQGGLDVLLVHRPRYDDWSLPKGKAEPDEPDEVCALREVLEETGLSCTLGAELETVRYRDARGRPKQVRYFAMTVVGGVFAPHDEVDAIVWLPLDEAIGRLSYGHDRALLASVRTGLL